MNNISTMHKVTGGKKAAGAKSKLKRQNDFQGFLMLCPQIIGFLVFSVYPILWVFFTAWFDYDMIKYTFVGIDNFIRVFTRDPAYWNSVLYTFKIVFFTNVIQIPLALFVAILMNSKFVKAKTMFRTVFYMPNIISTAIVALIFSFIFSAFDGIANNILEFFRVIDTPINWFATTKGATIVVIIVSIWQGFGVNMLFFLSGLVGIPQELYEAAEVDGASTWQKFCNVTWPMLKPMLQIIAMLSITSGLKSSDLLLVLTNGAPGGSTEVVMTYLLKKFLPYETMEFVPQVGYAAALGVITSIIIGIITVCYLRMTRNMGKSVY